MQAAFARVHTLRKGWIVRLQQVADGTRASLRRRAAATVPAEVHLR